MGPFGSSPASSSGGSAVLGMGLGSILGPIGGIAGNIIGGLFGRSGQQDANRQNLQIAREQMAFQREMSSTALQRSAADAQKAGLNRILALGRPASTPSGAQATMQNKNAAIQQGIQQSVATALQVKKLNQEIKESDSRIEVQKADVHLKGLTGGTQISSALLNDSATAKNAAMTAGIRTENRIKELDRRVKEMNIPQAQNLALFHDWLQQSSNALLFQKLKHAAPIIKDYAQAVGTITGAFNLRNILGRKGSGRITTQQTKYNRHGEYQGGSITTRQ